MRLSLAVCGLQELHLLRYLNAEDPYDACHCVRLLDAFDYRGHTCLVRAGWPPSPSLERRDVRRSPNSYIEKESAAVGPSSSKISMQNVRPRKRRV